MHKPAKPMRARGAAKKPRQPETPGAALRAEAARALARVVFEGASLRSALADANPRIADSRDRALLAASLFAASRWWLRFDAALDALTEKPLLPRMIPNGVRSLR